MEDDVYDFIFKVIVIGDKSVGKSSLIRQFKENKFDNRVPTTIGVEFHVKDLNIDGNKVKLQLWDTAGEEEYKALTSVFYRRADAAVVVFDISRSETFDHVNGWIDAVYDQCDSNVLISMVGNKSDLCVDFDVERVCMFSELHMIPFVETSAKDASSVMDMFIRLTESLVERHTQLMSLQSVDSGPGSLLLRTQDVSPSQGYCC